MLEITVSSTLFFYPIERVVHVLDRLIILLRRIRCSRCFKCSIATALSRLEKGRRILNISLAPTLLRAQRHFACNVVSLGATLHLFAKTCQGRGGPVTMNNRVTYAFIILNEFIDFLKIQINFFFTSL